MATGRLLLADPSPIVLEGLRSFLARPGSGWEICASADDGREAVAKAATFRPQVVIMNFQLPPWDGLEAAAQIRRSAPGVEVLLFTSAYAPHLLLKVYHSHVRGCLLQTEPLAEVLPALEVVRRHHRFRSAALTEECEKLAASSPGHLRRRLTDRQTEILRLIAEGFPTKKIATRLGLSDRTIETHRTNLFRKLGCHSVAELVRYAIRHGEVEL